jgi:hypothetical protein
MPVCPKAYDSGVAYIRKGGAIERGFRIEFGTANGPDIVSGVVAEKYKAGQWDPEGFLGTIHVEP